MNLLGSFEVECFQLLQIIFNRPLMTKCISFYIVIRQMSIGKKFRLCLLLKRVLSIRIRHQFQRESLVAYKALTPR